MTGISDKGFVIDDPVTARVFLTQVGYYRVRAYLLPFRTKNGYQQSVPFSQVMSLYHFDSELRSWMYPIIGDIECHVRTALAFHLAFTYEAQSYLEEQTFDPKRHRHNRYLECIEAIIRANSNSPVVKHHKGTYQGRFPIWVIVEFCSTGLLSFTYADLRRSDRKIIASTVYHTGDQQLESWLRSFTELRNKCAHYTRLYLWRFTAIAKTFRGATWQMDNSLFSQIYMLSQLYPDKQTWNKHVYSLSKLIQKYEGIINLSHIGFPPDWQNHLDN